MHLELGVMKRDSVSETSVVWWCVVIMTCIACALVHATALQPLQRTLYMYMYYNTTMYT